MYVNSIKQNGAALLIMMLVLMLTASTFMMARFDSRNIEIERDKKTAAALAEAKQALIALAVNRNDLPGLMPYPDRNNDGNYDGKSDCFATNVKFSTRFSLGQLPLFENDPNCINNKITLRNGIEIDLRDGNGDRLWYEVSENLLYDYSKSKNETPPLIINPNIIKSPPQPWLIVRDRNGNIISDRVAVVIISPQSPLSHQKRLGGISDPDQYLDKIVMADGTPYRNYEYRIDGINNKQSFIVGENSRNVGKFDSTYKNRIEEPYHFNDKLVYITIDELMEALEYRVLKTAKKSILDLSKNKKLPDAGSLFSNEIPSCIAGNKIGRLPINSDETKCICENPKKCSCDFSGLQYIKIVRKTGQFSQINSGLCNVENEKTCKCFGEGNCKSSSGFTNQVVCNSDGVCSTGLNNVEFIFFAKESFSVDPKPSGQCKISQSNNAMVICNGHGNFNIKTCGLTIDVPDWFLENKWHEFILYDSRNNLMTLGGKTFNGMLISAGQPLKFQKRPSSNIKDYLDTLINSDLDLIYEKSNRARSEVYNDQFLGIFQQ